MKSIRTLGGVVALAGLWAGDALAGKKERAEDFLVRPDPAPDADARGRIKLETEAGKDRDRLELRADHVDDSGTFDVYIEDALGSATFVLLGAMQADDSGSGELRLKFDEQKAPLPLAIASVSELYGRQLEVRDGGSAVVLEGAIPDPADQVGKKGFSKAKATLALPLGAPDPDAQGRVEIWHKGKDNRERFRVKAEHLDTLGVFVVEVEDDVGAGTFTAVGTMSADASDDGGFKLYLDKQQGDPMPFGLPVDDLAGRVVRIADGTSAVVLEGVIPDLF